MNHHDHNQHSHQQNQHHDHNHSQNDHHNHVDHTGHEIMFRNRFWVSLILTIPVLVFSPALQNWLGFDTPEFSGSNLIAPLFSIIIFLYGGIPFIQMAVPEIKRRVPGMMTLISMAISVAFIYSVGALLSDSEDTFFWEMATLIDIMLLGHWFEMRSVRQASGALSELAKLMPDTAERLSDNGDIETVSISDLNMGDTVLVRPGASVPVDGEIAEGESSVNEAMITGESKPVHKSVGDSVIGGTINGDGSLRVKVTAIGDETTLAGIMRLVKDAQESKSETQILADKAAGWLFYVAIGMAAITAIAWLIATGFDIEVVKRVVTVLVIACPHALGLAIPLVVAITTTLAARNGILIRNRAALETVRGVNIVVFDKTGTLTKGEQGIVDHLATAEWESDQALALTAAIEGDSEHMIAHAFRHAAHDKSLDLPTISNFEAIKGRGVKATYENQTVYVGGPRLLEHLSLDLSDDMQQFTQQSGQKGHSVVYLIQGKQIVAAYALADVIRDESYAAVTKLHEMGIQVAMLTGDSQAVAKAVADELGIDQFFAEVLPEDKDKKVVALQQGHQTVMMVGDGVNDAPALTRADIGIAIGSGTDVAIESADIVLVKSNPLDIVKIISLSQSSYRKMIQNLIWATGYNVVALPLAAGILAPIGILLSPAVGAIFMSISTIVVAINAQLLRTWESTAA